MKFKEYQIKWGNEYFGEMHKSLLPTIMFWNWRIGNDFGFAYIQ